MRTRVWFDGNELTEWCVVSDLQRPLLPRDIQMVSVPGRDGGLLAGVTLADRTLTLTLTFRGKPDKRADAMRKVAAMLNVAERKNLTISEDNGLSYLAIPNAMENGTRSVNAESFVVTFSCEPLMVSNETRRVDFSVTEQGEVSFLVDGTAPCPCILVAPDNVAGTFVITVDTGEVINLGGGATSVQRIQYSLIDSQKRTMQTLSTNRLPSIEDFASASYGTLPIDSDWLILKPGLRTLSIASSAHYEQSGYIVYSPRWV